MLKELLLLSLGDSHLAIGNRLAWHLSDLFLALVGMISPSYSPKLKNIRTSIQRLSWYTGSLILYQNILKDVYAY